LQNGETIGSVSIAYGTGAAASAAVGTYVGSVVPSAATGGTFTASNYTITYVPGNIIVLLTAPTITISGNLTAVNTTYGSASASPASFIVSGTNLTAGITITAPSGYEVSTSAASGYATSINLNQSAGAISNTVVYVRLSALATVVGSPYSGNIVCSSTGATSQNIATVASSVAPAPLTISANNISKFYGLTTNPTAFTATGLLNGDAVTSVTLSSTGSTATANVGAYNIVSSNATGTGLGNYTITYTNGTLTVLPVSLTITAANQAKCLGDVLTLPANGYAVNGLVNSDAVIGVTLTSTGTGSGTAAGTYSIVPSAATGTGLANYTISYINGTLTVNALPTVTATASSSSVSRGRNVTLTATGTGSFAWTPTAGIVSPNAAVTEARVTARTTYTVTLTAANGCRNTASVTVDAVEDFFVEPAVVFTPNGDGINDRFVIKNLDQYPQNKLQVFDRSGKVVYEYINYSNNWDGTFNGKTLIKDTYFYILTVKGQIVKRGAITVVR
jgi:gliding motility-associated-like protein